MLSRLHWSTSGTQAQILALPPVAHFTPCFLEKQLCTNELVTSRQLPFLRLFVNCLKALMTQDCHRTWFIMCSTRRS